MTTITMRLDRGDETIEIRTRVQLGETRPMVAERLLKAIDHAAGLENPDHRPMGEGWKWVADTGENGMWVKADAERK